MSTTSNMLMGIVLMLVLNAVFMMANLGVREYDEYATFGDTRLLDRYGDRTNGTLREFTGDELPATEESVSPETGISFTDIFRTSKNWILEKTGGQYVIDFLTAPVELLRTMNLAPQLIFIIGALWYGMFIFLIVSWLFNR